MKLDFTDVCFVPIAPDWVVLYDIGQIIDIEPDLEEFI
ncbi:hypothetical protein DSUL_170012 [Desulfovibrionales bacterium]